MAQRHARVSTIGEFQGYHFTATQQDTLIDAKHVHGSFLGSVIINQPGSSDVVVTLGNGTTNTPGNIFAVLKPGVDSSDHTYNMACDRGLYVAITGTTVGDYTITALNQAV
jgi:hypothetical protein